LSGRMARLLRPVLVYAAVWVVIPPVLGRLGLPGEQVQLVGRIMGQPLWFLGVYLVVVALAPAMVRLHRRFRLWVPATLAAPSAAAPRGRLSPRALAALAAAGLAGLLALTGTGLYPPSMVGLPGDRSNMSPPPICIVALTVWQPAL